VESRTYTAPEVFAHLVTKVASTSTASGGYTRRAGEFSQLVFPRNRETLIQFPGAASAGYTSSGRRAAVVDKPEPDKAGMNIGPDGKPRPLHGDPN